MKALWCKSGVFLFIIYVLSFIFVSTAACLEITPFVGYRFGGSLEDDLANFEMDLNESESFGVAFDFDLSPGKQIKLFYSHQKTDVKVSPSFIVSPEWEIAVDYLHIGGITSYNTDQHLQPFVAGGFGLTRVDPERFGPETRFSLSLAGGGKLFLSENIGMRVEARSYWTFFDSNSAVFCNNGGCRVLIEGDTWWQFETNLGMFFRF